MTAPTTPAPPRAGAARWPRRGRAAVIGGGIAGLATAALLAKEGYDVDLLEQRDNLGGRAGTWEAGGFRFDTGPSWYLMPEVFDHFFELLGTSAEEQLDLVALDPAYRVYFEGEQCPVDIRGDRVANVDAFEAIEPGAGAALERYLRSAEDAYAMATRRFLYTTFASPRGLLRRDVLTRLPALARLLLVSLEKHVAGQFIDHRLRQILGYPAVFLGSSPDRAPSMYHLMSAMDLTGGVLYPQGGFGRLIDVVAALAERHGARLHTGATVTEITTAPLAGRGPSGLAGALSREERGRGGGLGTRSRVLSRRGIGAGRRAAVTGVRYRTADGAERTLAADVVVAAADLHHVETALLPRALQTYPASWWARRTSGPGAVLVCLGVRGSLPQLPHHSLFFTADWRANFDAIFGSSPRVPEPASVYVCKPSETDPSVAPPGTENLFVLVPVPADVRLGRGGIGGTGSAAVERVADAAIDQIAAWAGAPDLGERILVRRTYGPGDFAGDLNAWSGGMLGPAHTLRQSAFLRGSNASKKVAGLYYAGSSTIPGIGLPMCLISAEIAVKRLRGDVSTEPLAVPL